MRNESRRYAINHIISHYETSKETSCILRCYTRGKEEDTSDLTKNAPDHFQDEYWRPLQKQQYNVREKLNKHNINGLNSHRNVDLL